MRVRFFEIEMNGSTRTESLLATMDIDVLPRQGERVYFDAYHKEFTVKSIVHAIDQKIIDIYIIF